MSTVTTMKSTRPYTMTARARAVEATRTSILEAVRELSETRMLRDIALEDVAARAEVSVQTVLRQFGSRAALLEAAAAHVRESVEQERQVPRGDVAQALRVLVDHYEKRGDPVLLLLAQERSEELAARATGMGRALHRAWVEDVFAPFLPAADAARARAVDLLVVATDLYTWKLLRRDRGLSRAGTRERMEALVRMVLTGLGTPHVG